MATYLKSLSTLRSLLDSHPRVEDESTWIHGPTTKEPKQYKHKTCSMTCEDTRRRRWWVHPVIGGSADPLWRDPRWRSTLPTSASLHSTNLGPHVNGGSADPLLVSSRSVSLHRLNACLTRGSNPHHPSMAVSRGSLSKG